MAGAITAEDYRHGLELAGFVRISVQGESGAGSDNAGDAPRGGEYDHPGRQTVCLAGVIRGVRSPSRRHMGWG